MFAAQVRPLAKADSLIIGETFTLDSQALGETRRLNVYLPALYKTDPSQRLSVLYVLDGGMTEDFLHIAGLWQVCVYNGILRPFILVDIENTQRRRDLTGPTEITQDKTVAPVVGGSVAFRTFLRKELMPRIKERYRITPEAAVSGESLAGLFILETFFTEPDLFGTYFAYDPSLWWNNQALIKAAGEGLRTWSAGERTVYFASRGEPSLALLVQCLAEVFAHDAPAQIRWHYQTILAKTHATIRHPAALQAFQAVFKPEAEALK